MTPVVEPPPTLRVLIAADDLHVGGVSRFIVDLANSLAAEGHAVTVVAAHGRFEADLRGVRLRSVPASLGRVLGKAAVWARLVALVASGPFDVVHTHQRGVGLVAVIGARLNRRRRPVVVEHVHNIFAPGPLGRLLSFRGDRLIACGSQVLDMLVREFGVTTDRATLVLNGVSDPPALPAAPQESGVRLVGVGRLHPQKDPLRFVRALGQLRSRHPDLAWTAEWMGDGPLQGDMQEAIRQHSLGDRLTLLGDVHDVPRRLHGATALLLTSAYEGVPLVALEALSVGVPVVLPDVGSCRDVVDTTRAGVVYEAGTADEALADLLADALRTGRIHDWARLAEPAWREHFRFSRVVDQVLAVYRAVLPRTTARQRRFAF